MSTVIGTSNYLAPEILSGKLYTLKCDVYALGTILYILLCGYPPFDDEENPSFFNDVVKGNLKFPSPEWDSISPEGELTSEEFDSKHDGDRSRQTLRHQACTQTSIHYLQAEHQESRRRDSAAAQLQ